MKKEIALILVCAVFFSPGAANAKTKVITSITVLKSLTESIGKNLVDVSSIGRGTEDPHFVEVRPSYMMTIASAKLYISTGMSLDHWAKPLIENSRNIDIVMVNASKGIRVLGIPTERVSALLGDVHPEGNPHYWLDPYNIPVMVKNIVTGLSQVDPANAEIYQKNARVFLDQLKTADAGWQKRLKPYAGTKVITYHESWDYFDDHFKFVAIGQVEPKPGIPPSGSHTEEIIQLVKREKVRLILQEPFYPSATPDLIAEKTGAMVVKFPQLCEGAPHTDSYIELMEYNVTAVEKALKK
jgi:zinc/manganese transport system substrate-binding protein